MTLTGMTRAQLKQLAIMEHVITYLSTCDCDESSRQEALDIANQCIESLFEDLG